MTQRRLLVSGGYVLTMDAELGDLTTGDVLIDGGTIAAVAPRIEEPVDEVIDATGALVIPGLVDTHTHLWQVPLRGLAAELWGGEYFTHVLPYRTRFRPEDMYAGGYVGGLEALSNGTTTVLDFCHAVASPEHADAAVAGIADSGLRGVFGYTIKHKPAGRFASQEERMRDLLRLRSSLSAGDGRISVMAALSDLETIDIPTCRREVAFARDAGLRMTIHSNFDGQITAMNNAGLLGPDLLPVHCRVVTDDELRMLAGHGTPISFTPAVEVHGGPCGVLARALRRGISVTWGCDIPSFVNVDLFAQIRLILHVQGLLDGEEERRDGRSGARRPGIPTLGPRQALRAATLGGATALGLGDRIGSISPGKDADLVVLRAGRFGLSLGDPTAHIVYHSGAQDVDTVLVAGEVRKRGGVLCVPGLCGAGGAVAPGRVDDLISASRDYLFAAELVPAADE